MKEKAARIAVCLLVCMAVAGFTSQIIAPSYASEGNRSVAASVTIAPTANDGLIYTAAKQELAKAGTASNGTMQYALEDITGGLGRSDWDESVPGAINAGTYRVWYKAVGDAGYGDSEPEFIIASIAKRTLVITPKTQIYRYNGQIQGPGDLAYENPAELAEVVHLDGLQGDDTLLNICIDGQGKEVGTYPLIATQANLGKVVGNYDREYVEGKMIIRGMLHVTVTGSSTEKTYSGKEQAYKGAVTATSSDKAFDVSKFRYTGNTVVKGTKAGDYVRELEKKYCEYNDECYELDCTLGSPIRLTINSQGKLMAKMLAKMTHKGKEGLVLAWNKIEGAKGYDVFFSKCGTAPCKKVKTIKGNKTFEWTKKGLKEGTAYKSLVKAWTKKNGKKTYLRTSPMVHAYASGYSKTGTNPKSIKVKKAKVSLIVGKSSKIKAKVVKLKKGKKLMSKDHVAKLRYLSSNKKVATVDKSGKIAAKSKGNCKIYVIGANGVCKAVKVTVK